MRADIKRKIDHSVQADPEKTYETIRETINTAYKHSFPKIKKRFQRHKHKIQPWMTDEILQQIKLLFMC